MQKILLTIAVMVILAPVVIVGCGKSTPGYSSCTDMDVTADSSALLGFARARGITPVKDTSGLYYQIVSQGSGATPAATSTIFVTYTGTLMDGTIFDSTSNSAKTGFVLNRLVPGWQIGLPKIGAGGHIKLLIPSRLAYGCQGAGGRVPPYSPVYFDVNLVSIQ